MSSGVFIVLMFFAFVGIVIYLNYQHAQRTEDISKELRESTKELQAGARSLKGTAQQPQTWASLVTYTQQTIPDPPPPPVAPPPQEKPEEPEEEPEPFARFSLIDTENE